MINSFIKLILLIIAILYGVTGQFGIVFRPCIEDYSNSLLNYFDMINSAFIMVALALHMVAQQSKDELEEFALARSVIVCPYLGVTSTSISTILESISKPDKKWVQTERWRS